MVDVFECRERDKNESYLCFVAEINFELSQELLENNL